MSNYRTNGVHQLNKWLWDELRTLTYKGSPAFAKYAGAGGSIPLVPIVPSQQIAEFTEIAGGAPFIVYNYTDVGTPDWWLSEMNASWIIYDNDEERLRTIHNYMVDLLKRQDWTAADINSYILGGIEPGTQGDLFDFKTVVLTSSAGPEPFESQGGRQGAMIVVRFSYTYEVSNDPNRLGMRI